VEPSIIAPPHIPGIELFSAKGHWCHEEAQAPAIVSSTSERQSRVVAVEVQAPGRLDILMQQIQKFPQGTSIEIQVELDSGAPILFLAVVIFLLGAYMIYSSKPQEDSVMLEGQSDEEKSSMVLMNSMDPLEQEGESVDGEESSMIVVDLMV